jgi:phospho-N-acetylmuramoyl-pentapeptide-transferase
MFYHLLYPLKEIFFGFNVFRYITFRASGAAITAFLFSLLFVPFLIRRLKALKFGQYIQKDSLSLYNLHQPKEGTPTMGGIVVLLSILISTFLWADLTNKYILLASFCVIYLGILGFIDDFIKIKRHNPKGLKISQKLFGQFFLGIVIGVILYFDKEFSTRLDLPFFKKVILDLGIFYIFFCTIVIAGSSNAVNLTDGLDGLAVGCVIMVSLAYGALSYLTGNIKFSHYLFIPYIRGTGELAIFCSSIFGGCLGFLWYNAYPAQIFMGDTGSLALGGALGVVSLLIKKEILLIIVGGIFVLEAISVILQVASFRIRGKRIFKIAPLHHHFQMLGWPESKVIVRFWIVAIILALMSLTTLKLR